MFRLLGLLLTALWLAAGPACAGSPPGQLGLPARLDAALAAPALRGGQLAALVVEAESGRELYARHPDRALTPASNLKLLTAAASLSALGPSYRFTTEVLADAAPDAEGAVGQLYLRGSGDPALTSEQWWRLAADLRARGLRRVRGDLVVDDGYFDAARWHPAWGKVSARAYHAPVGALAANYGAFEVHVDPGRAVGAPLRVQVDPPVPYLQIVNRARTGAPGSRTNLYVGREAGPGVEQVVVTGTLPLGAPRKRVARSVADPTGYAAAVCRMQLAALGIRVEGGVRVGRVPADAVLLHEFEGADLAEIVRLFMKWSNNAIGESLVKALGARANGAPGSWGNGLPALREELSGMGLPLDGLRLGDGSGLSTDNRASPRLLVQTLRLARRSFGFGPEFVTALPRAAEDGTLRDRAEAAVGAVRAKTGLLTGVTGLSGFARSRDGRELAFSVLANGYRGGDAAAMAALDGFVAALVQGASLMPAAAGN